jgi:hypothetical protein
MEQFIIMSPCGIQADNQYYNWVKSSFNIALAYYEMELETGKAFTHRLPSPVIELHEGNAEAAWGKCRRALKSPKYFNMLL